MNRSTDITLVVDASPSMHPQTKETIQGVNQFVWDQIATAAKADSTLKISIVTFSNTSSEIEGITLDEQNYKPIHGNGTALYDAVQDAIDRTGARLRALPASKRPEKVLFVILTDGEENASRRHTQEKVRSSIRHQTEEYKWDFVFLGSNQDAWQTGDNLGFASSKTMTYAQNGVGIRSAFASASSYASNTVNAASACDMLKNSFTVADVAAQSAAGLDTDNLSVPVLPT